MSRDAADVLAGSSGKLILIGWYAFFGGYAMKHRYTVACLLIFAASAVQADRTIVWKHDTGIGDGGTGVRPYNNQDPTGWRVAMYVDGGDGAISSFARVFDEFTSLGDDALAVDSGSNPRTTTVDNGYNTGGPENDYLLYYETMTVIPGQRVFTVVFNHANESNATHYLVIDDNLYTIPAGDPSASPVDYNAGSASIDEWKPILSNPAPTMAILDFDGLSPVWSNSNAALTYTIEWTSDLLDSNMWTTADPGLENIAPARNIVTSTVPTNSGARFFRVIANH